MARTVRRLTRALNPMLMGLASSGWIPVWALVTHVGRRSGRVYRTPIAIRPTASGFVIPLPWGDGTDWCRNLIAANGGVVRWKGADYPVVAPEVVERSVAAPAFPAALRALLPVLGIKRFLAVHRVDAAPVA
jgi:deazaflavin-dependent oxidoreductase (nitroreductase family)